MVSALKKKKESHPLRWLVGAGRPVLILAIVAAILAGGGYLAWLRLEPKILDTPEYLVGPEQIEINDPPSWIRSDLRAAAFRQPTLDGKLSLMDDTLVERIRSAFKELPWVAGVRKVEKRYPASVVVELEYRQPACMVEVPGGVQAVDADAVLLLRDDFTPVEATRYPRLSGVDQLPIGPAGRRWSDPRVVGGAEIAAVLGKVWERMNLSRIEALPANAVAQPPSAVDDPLYSNPRPGAAGAQALSAESTPGGPRSSEPVFALRTRAGTRIVWGYAPRANVLGEPTAAEKLALLQQRMDERDSLDGPQGQPQHFDVRTLEVRQK